jgi:hypothetical protein
MDKPVIFADMDINLIFWITLVRSTHVLMLDKRFREVVENVLLIRKIVLVVLILSSLIVWIANVIHFMLNNSENFVSTLVLIMVVQNVNKDSSWVQLMELIFKLVLKIHVNLYLEIALPVIWLNKVTKHVLVAKLDSFYNPIIRSVDLKLQY